jgi:UDP-glucose 4-epimerase
MMTRTGTFASRLFGNAKEVVQMHVLVTGGCGFIGSHSVDALLRKGAQVRVLDDFSNGDLGNLPAHPNLEVLEGDIRDRATVVHAMWGVTHVLHLAAQVSVRGSVANPGYSCAINVNGFLNVLDAAVLEGVQRFVYASSAAVYGNSMVAPVYESQTCAPINPYGLEKLINEQYAALYRRMHKLPCLGLRYFNVYGPRQTFDSRFSGVVSRFLAAAREGGQVEVHGDGQQSRDFVYVEDVAEVNRLALSSDAEGLCNVATGQSTAINDLIRAIAKQVGTPFSTMLHPSREGDARFSGAHVDHLRRTLGFAPSTRLAEGLRQMCLEEMQPGITSRLHSMH